MKILVACEYSGIVRDAFLRKGHETMSCDILDTESPGPHYKGDVRDVLDGSWDMVIAHPPCTYLANSGSRWLYEKPGRWGQMEDGAEFFKMFFGSAPKVAIENPTIHRHAKEIIGRGSDQRLQPWMFGHLESKAVCLWLEGLPPLIPTNNVYDSMMELPSKERNKVWWMGSGKAKERSRFFEGIAEAMADQWGCGT